MLEAPRSPPQDFDVVLLNLNCRHSPANALALALEVEATVACGGD